MALDSLIRTTVAVPSMVTMRAALIRGWRPLAACPAQRDWALGLLLGAIGLAVASAAPDALLSPVGVLGQAALLLGAGFVWSGARRLVRGTAPRPTAVAAGALAWLGVILAASPTLGWRIAVGSALVAAIAAAAARELMRLHTGRGDPRRAGGLVLAAYGALWGLQALLGAAWGTNPRGWIGWVSVLAAALFGALSPAMSRQPGSPTPRDEPLEDALTGIGNHRALVVSGAALMAEAEAARRPVALLVMDLDGFAGLAERHGAETAERLLAAFARLAHAYLPPTSLVCRLGGDIFAALVPGAAPDRARSVADELRSLFAHLTIACANGPVAATVSIGVAQARPGRTRVADLLGMADTCLSAAKHGGRNRVVHEAELSASGWDPVA